VVLPVAAAVVAAATAVPAVGARPRTTAPGLLYIVKVTVTDTTIRMPRDRFTLHGITSYPRGALIRYTVTNLGTRPYTFEIWSAKTLPIRPKHHDSVLVAWNRRGTFVYRTLSGGRSAGPKGVIRIF